MKHEFITREAMLLGKLSDLGAKQQPKQQDTLEDGIKRLSQLAEMAESLCAESHRLADRLGGGLVVQGKASDMKQCATGPGAVGHLHEVIGSIRVFLEDASSQIRRAHILIG